MVEPSLQALEQTRKDLYQQLAGVGDFRRGTVSVNYRKCGKSNCKCARPDHPGHGPQYLWNATIDGKSRARNLRLGPELEKVGVEVEGYRRFVGLCRGLVQVNERICDLRGAAPVGQEVELDQLKKKLRRKYSGKRRRR